MRVEMDYCKGRELFLLLLLGMLSSGTCRQHLLTALTDGAVCQSFVFMTGSCGFTKSIHTCVHRQEHVYKKVNVYIYD